MEVISAYVPSAALNAHTISQLPLALPEMLLLIMASVILIVDLFVSDKTRGATYILTQATLLGLAFRPVSRGRTSDIQGVLWLNRTNSRLERMEFSYTRLPFPVESERSFLSGW